METKHRQPPNRGARQQTGVREMVEDLATRGDHSPSSIRQEVLSTFGDGVTPSLKTVKGMVDAVRARDAGESWSPALDETGAARLVLGVLADVIETTNGQVTSITRAEATTVAANCPSCAWASPV